MCVRVCFIRDGGAEIWRKVKVCFLRPNGYLWFIRGSESFVLFFGSCLVHLLFFPREPRKAFISSVLVLFTGCCDASGKMVF